MNQDLFGNVSKPAREPVPQQAASLSDVVYSSLSGGMTSSYMALHYPADVLIFALVRTRNKKLRFPDRVLASRIEQRIGDEFVGTTEEDPIIYTLLDLEQKLGREIKWVSGITFDELIEQKKILPNKAMRFCTEFLKVEPIFRYWQLVHSPHPVRMQIGYRANESDRLLKMNDRIGPSGYVSFKTIVGAWESGRHKGKAKWGDVPYMLPQFPLWDDGVYKVQIERFWNKDGAVRIGNIDDNYSPFPSVRFAIDNNCVGCFWRSPRMLGKKWKQLPHKMQWFADHEGEGTWKTGISYEQIKNIALEELSIFSNSCDSGLCGI